jgi:P-type Mg2+ transporter
MRSVNGVMLFLPNAWLRSAAHPPVADSDGLRGYWATHPDLLAGVLDSGRAGLSSAEAADRLCRFGANELQTYVAASRLRVLGRQFRSPLLLILLFAAAAAAATGEWTDSAIVILIIAASTGLAYVREYAAASAADALRDRIRTRTTVVRDGSPVERPVAEIVPGDIVLLSAGCLVPADAVVLEAADFFVSEAVLTGESFPVEKSPGVCAPAATLRERTNSVLLGSNVRSGSATCLVIHTGRRTQFGRLADRLVLRAPETEFDRGLRHFGYLLTIVMFVMVLAVFTVHTLVGSPPIETLFFAIALAVGLSPELLPAILAVNLAHGAQVMAAHGVLVRRLTAIENLGSMDVFCTDKTGTLTEGIVELEGAYDAAGEKSAEVLGLAALNASMGTGLAGPLDEAILRAHGAMASPGRKLAELPFDASRKRASIVIESHGAVSLVSKGAFERILDACTCLTDGRPIGDEERGALAGRFEAWSRDGIRVLAVAVRTLDVRDTYSRGDERGMTFSGFLTFFDRPKPEARQALADLAQLGVATKIISGDSRLVAQHVAELVGLRSERTLTGADLNALNDEALWQRAERTDLFAEVDPNQKERIILALKKTGHVVGFLGDGVNDAPAMHAADTSLSVESAVDVAREAADFVLLDRDLSVLRRGIQEGRRTFANTLKYILTTTSANLGNMLSMAVASWFLPFLPLLAGQILLNNFLSDIPAIGLAGDSVDPELVDRPRRWDMPFIRRFMIEFGLVSSAFDMLTFALLLLVFAAGPELFRTAWFVESLLTELLIALVVRTRRPFYASRPGTLLLTSTLVLVALTLVLPYLPFVTSLGFVPLPPILLLSLSLVAASYVLGTELLKRWFFRPGGALPPGSARYV